MFRKKFLLTLFCLVQGASFMDKGPNNSDNYGLYDIEIYSYEVIKGPKQKSIAAFNFTVTQQNGDYFCHSNLTLLEQGRLEEVKVTVYSVEGTRKSLLWNYRLTNPCAHFVLGPMIERYMHTNNCVFKKGIYLSDVNMSDVIKKFLGTSFFYGDFIFRVYYFTKNANIMGLIINQSFTKK